MTQERFISLVRAEQEPLRRFLLALCGGDAALADDIAQDAPAQIVQVTINFICSMQYNTFRQAEGIPMATTFVTNHIRQTGIWAVTAIKRGDRAAGSRAWKHFRMIGMFFLGALILTPLCTLLQERAIWFAMVPLIVSFALMLNADLVVERMMFDQKPHGH